ncbi:hypothetical protein AVEN_195326-1 [Araneus ventricosus]|uniref:Uncharacterized protein n=1 Tax=Araneus ventricosus TaxID=182803 RepID=A0A4Y2S6E7_ARAVE|nr:hypothetical protein AVEN_195326-1 [Araneus ventricosus]
MTRSAQWYDRQPQCTPGSCDRGIDDLSRTHQASRARRKQKLQFYQGVILGIFKSLHVTILLRPKYDKLVCWARYSKYKMCPNEKGTLAILALYQIPVS